MANSVLTVGESFPTWHRTTTLSRAAVWAAPANWDKQGLLPQLIELFEDELEAHFHRPPEKITAICAAVFDYLCSISLPTKFAVTLQVHFFRLFVVAKAVEYCQMHGRASLQYDWLICAVSDRRYESIEPGTPLEVDYYPDRLFQFACSAHPIISRIAPWTILAFLRGLYYYAWKNGGLRELAENLLEDAQNIITDFIDDGEDDQMMDAVVAASALATWCHQFQKDKARKITLYLVQLSHILLSADHLIGRL